MINHELLAVTAFIYNGPTSGPYLNIWLGEADGTTDVSS